MSDRPIPINPVELPEWALRLARTAARECRPEGTYTVRIVMPERGREVAWSLAREDVIRRGQAAGEPGQAGPDNIGP